MKKILYGIFLIFVCNLANADVKVVNDITDGAKINWAALDDALIHLSSDGSRANMMTFFIYNEKNELSAANILSHCFAFDDGYSCANFVKAYMNYVPGNANDCTTASSLVGTPIWGDPGNYYFETFQEALARCESVGYGGWHRDEHNKVVPEIDMPLSDSNIFSICGRFLKNVKNCTLHLEAYYTQELLSKRSDKKTRKQNECILNLVQTGQLDLPVSIMEDKCK